ncbi:DUF992 domain-containing protein [Hyphomicrobium sp. NDB2Meth4]|uniref:DUF992 domain-containing protein n=1 Tax=Hyphomicrobium sp. NDB2Meth4 TaxID=1892846 RepID=UPI000930C1E8|nr:DUF992 domain-containing protein [Hyphomicrobium sp. NDB2Meth4]
MRSAIANKTATRIAASMAAAFAIVLPAQAAHVEIGVLTCQVSGGIGFVFGSSKDLDCTFKGPRSVEHYFGSIDKFGIDLGFTDRAKIVWTVFAPTRDLEPGALAGKYGGVSAEATVGLGVGANALLGGSHNSIALQPLSVSGQEGLNIAVGVAALRLRAE